MSQFWDLLSNNLNFKMPNTSSAKKAMRQSRRRNTINLRTKSKFKSAVKATRTLIAEGNAKESVESLKKAMSALDKAVKKDVLHKNTASRKKSRLAKAIAKLSK
jgi:small subunit ribosomal protein S20